MHGKLHARTEEITSLKDIVAAVRAVEDAIHQADGGLWRIGDLLIQECGKPGARGVNTGALGKLKRIANALKREGFGKKYSTVYLRKLRETAADFPDDKRLSSVSWSVHMMAGDPETLTNTAEQAEREKKDLTVEYVKQFRQRQDDERKAKDRRNHLAGLPEPDAARVIAIDDFRSAANDAEKLGQGARYIEPHVEHLSAKQREDLFAAAKRVVRVWSDRADLLEPPVGLREAAE